MNELIDKVVDFKNKNGSFNHANLNYENLNTDDDEETSYNNNNNPEDTETNENYDDPHTDDEANTKLTDSHFPGDQASPRRHTPNKQQSHSTPVRLKNEPSDRFDSSPVNDDDYNDDMDDEDELGYVHSDNTPDKYVNDNDNYYDDDDEDDNDDNDKLPVAANQAMYLQAK